MRRKLLWFVPLVAVIVVAIGLVLPQKHAAAAPTVGKTSFNVAEASITEMQAALEQGRVTSHELVIQYLARIGVYENMLRATVTVNPHVVADADRLDAERAQGHIRGPLHGIPIALKDNILTNDIVTTGGMLAFEGYIPPYDATLVKNLRDAGAIILAKTNLSELAGWIVAPPQTAPGNYTGVHGFGYNPYDPRKDPRPGLNDGRPVLNTGGSSSGAGTTASFWAANIGTETGGSILNPSNQNMLVGIKPTVGRTSRWGVIPITADQDSAGPMARSVTDAAIMLGAMESPSPDPNDPATTTCTPPPNKDYTPFLKADGLKGVRIGVPRAFYFDPLEIPGIERTRRGRGLNPAQAALMAEVIEILKKQGAILVDPANIPSVIEKDPSKNTTMFQDCRVPKGMDADCSVDFKYGMKRDFNKWLASLGPTAPVKTLTELRVWNLNHVSGGAIRFGQGTLDASDDQDLEVDLPRYLADRARDLDLSRKHGIDAVMKENNLDAIMFPGSSGTAIVDRAGYPSLIVPFGMIPNTGQQNQNNPSPPPPFPNGFNPKPQPYGVSFAGLACSEPKLVQIGYAFEQATKRRVPPSSTP